MRVHPSSSWDCISVLAPLYSSLLAHFPTCCCQNSPSSLPLIFRQNHCSSQVASSLPHLRFQNKKAFHAPALRIPTFYSHLTMCPDLRGWFSDPRKRRGCLEKAWKRKRACASHLSPLRQQPKGGGDVGLMV